MADAAAPLTTGVSKTPAEFLKAIKGKPVLVKLNSGVDYKGETSLQRGLHARCIMGMGALRAWCVCMHCMHGRHSFSSVGSGMGQARYHRAHALYA